MCLSHTHTQAPKPREEPSANRGRPPKATVRPRSNPVKSPHQAEVGDRLPQREPRHGLWVDEALEGLLPYGSGRPREPCVGLRKDGDVGDGQLQGAAALLLRDEAWGGGGVFWGWRWGGWRRELGAGCQEPGGGGLASGGAGEEQGLGWGLSQGEGGCCGSLRQLCF